MPAWWVVLAILRKDLEDAVRSHTLLPMFLGPILLSWFFAQTLSDSDLKRPEMAIFDPGSSALVRQLGASHDVKVVRVGSLAEGEALVERGQVPVAFEVPVGFDRQLEARDFPALRLTVDDARPTQVELARAALRGQVRTMAGQSVPADIREARQVRAERGGPGQRMLPYWVALAVLSALLVAAVSVVEEKEAGTLEQILCGPVGLGEVLLGKLSASWMLGFGSAVVMLVLNGAWQGLSVAGLLVLGLGSLAFAGLGGLIGLWAPSQATGTTLAGLVMLALFLPGALAEVSQKMAGAALWSPGYYFQDGVNRALNNGAGLSELSRNLTVLAATSVVVGLLGIWRLRRND